MSLAPSSGHRLLALALLALCLAAPALALRLGPLRARAEFERRIALVEEERAALALRRAAPEALEAMRVRLAARQGAARPSPRAASAHLAEAAAQERLGALLREAQGALASIEAAAEGSAPLVRVRAEFTLDEADLPRLLRLLEAAPQESPPLFLGELTLEAQEGAAQGEGAPLSLALTALSFWRIRQGEGAP